jgi:HAD superfamily hydrolase (TIGR01509 family)
MLGSQIRKRRRRGAKHSVVSIPRRIIGSMSMGSPASTAFAIFSYRAACGSPREARTIRQRPKQCGLGNRKNELVNKIIEDVGVKPYEGSVKFLHQLRSQGFKIVVVTSSQNCAAVLRAAKLGAFFDIRVDGNTILAEHLTGKPAPDTFLMAAKLLGVEPARVVVIEDALSGVEAGSNGNFELVIGVAHKGNAEELRRHGAHLVVNDLGELVS